MSSFRSFLIKIPIFKDSRGILVVIEKILKFKIKRIYFVYQNKKRGGHKHKKCKQFIICVKGKILVTLKKTNLVKKINLSKKNVGLYLHPQDWHEIVPLEKKSIYLVCCSENYNKKDYIYEI